MRVVLQITTNNTPWREVRMATENQRPANSKPETVSLMTTYSAKTIFGALVTIFKAWLRVGRDRKIVKIVIQKKLSDVGFFVDIYYKQTRISKQN